MLRKYIWLINLLQRRPMTFSEINERYLESRENTKDKNIPYEKRTFHNHIRFLKERFGIRIVCGPGYRYYIEDIDYDKVERLSLLNMMSETVSVNRSLYINDYFEIFRDKAVKSIMDAIQTKRKIKLDFNLIKMPEDRYRMLTVSPYQLHYISSKWFLIGWTDEFGLMRIPLFIHTGEVKVTSIKYILPFDYSSEEHSKMIYGTTKERIHLDIKIQDLYPERFNLTNNPLSPFQQKVEIGYQDSNEVSSSLNKYNIRVSFDLPKTPFALYTLKSKLDLYSYTVLNDIDPFTIFTEKEYENDVYFPVVL